MIGLPVFAEPLKATVSYTEEDARIEAFKGVRTLSIQHAVGWDDPKYNFDLSITNDNVLCVQEFKTKFMKVIPFKWVGVVYKDETNRVYTYEKTNNTYKLVMTETIEKLPNNLIRSLSYSKDGHLMSVSLTVDLESGEEFVFDENKKPIGHWTEDNWIGDKEHKNNITRNLIYFAP